MNLNPEPWIPTPSLNPQVGILLGGASASDIYIYIYVNIYIYIHIYIYIYVYIYIHIYINESTISLRGHPFAGGLFLSKRRNALWKFVLHSSTFWENWRGANDVDNRWLQRRSAALEPFEAEPYRVASFWSELCGLNWTVEGTWRGVLVPAVDVDDPRYPKHETRNPHSYRRGNFWWLLRGEGIVRRVD